MSADKKRMFLFYSILFTTGSLLHIGFNKDIHYMLPLSCLFLYLLYGMFEDIKSKEIYSAIHYPVIGVGIIYLICQGVSEKDILLMLAMNAVLQFLVMKNKYGMADCKMFFTLSLFYNYSLWQFEPLLISCFHIILSILIFVLYNMQTGNLETGWKLKEPKEFIPSIAIAALLFI